MSGKPERDPWDIHVGAAIKALRIKHGLSCAELARAIGKSEKLIHAIERADRHATPEVTRKIADALQVALAAITMPDYERICGKERVA